MEYIDLRALYRIAIKWSWLVLVCMLLAGGTAYIISRNTVPVYEASTVMMLERGGLSPSNMVWGDNQWEVQTYVELLPRVIPETADRLGLPPIDPGMVTVEGVNETRVVLLSVRDTDPERAAQIANALPDTFAEYTESLRLSRYTESKEALSKEMDRLDLEIDATQARIDDLGQPTDAAGETELARLEETLNQKRYNYGQLLTAYETMRLAEMQAKGSLVVFKSAGVPGTPVLPRTRRSTVLAAGLGAMFAAGVIFVIHYLDDTIKSPDDVSGSLGLITLSSIARLRRSRRGAEPHPLVTVQDPLSPEAEAFRVLRTNVQFSSVDRPIGRLLVTSPAPSNGKSFVSANLAVAFAMAGQPVVLVDGDLRRSHQHQLFDLTNEQGLTDSLIDGGGDGVLRRLQQTSVEDLALLTSGPNPPNPSELLGSRRMGELTERLVDQFKVVIVDAPPVLAVTDAAVLAQHVDGVVLVVDAGVTREREARRAIEELNKVDAPLLGVILNKVPSSEPGRYDFYYYQRYRYNSGNGSTSGDAKTSALGKARRWGRRLLQRVRPKGK